MSFKKKCVLAAILTSLITKTTTFCCPPSPTLAVSHETAQVIDATYKNLMYFSKEYNGSREGLIECSIDPAKIRVINLESILNAIFSDQPATVNSYLCMRNSEQLFSESLDDFLHSDKTSFACSSTSLYQGSCDFEKWKNEISELNIARSYMDYVRATFLTAYQRSQKYRDRIITFLAALEWRRKSDPEFRVYFTKGNKFEERLDDNILSLGLELSNGEHYKSKGYFFTLPLPEEESYPNELFPIKNVNDDIFTCMHEMGHGVHDLLGINFTKLPQIPFAWIANNPFMKGIFFSLLGRVEKNIDVFLSKIKVPEMREKLLENLLATQLKNSDFPGVSVDSKQYYEMCIQIVEANCRADWVSLEGTEIDEIKRTLSSNDFVADDAFLKKFCLLITQYMTFCRWTRLEELWQIMGTLAFGDNIFLMDSDLDVKIELGQRIRWFHIMALEISETEKSEESYTASIFAVPEEKFIKALFALHGVKYEDYLNQMIRNSL